MKYQEIEGDLIKLAKQGEFDVITHGCNCHNIMGAGIALQMDRACGQGHNASRNEKTWILDIDEVYSPELEKSLREYIAGVEPDAGEDKMVCEIPSKSGTHIITKPFNLKHFREYFEGIEVHKDNPTNLFIN